MYRAVERIIDTEGTRRAGSFCRGVGASPELEKTASSELEKVVVDEGGRGRSRPPQTRLGFAGARDAALTRL